MLTLVFAALALAIAAAVLSAPLALHRLESYEMPAAEQADRSGAERLLEALSELEQARLSGKLSEAEYAVQRQRLELEYVQVTERNAPVRAPSKNRSGRPPGSPRTRS